MNKKGFTLVELLGVIVVLAIIGLITMPIVNKTIKSSKEKAYKAQVKEIEKAAKDWSSDHIDEIPDWESLCPGVGNPINISVENLIDTGYIPEDAKNPLTGDSISGSVSISYDCEYNTYKYEYSE